jgi:hypothetical protein
MLGLGYIIFGAFKCIFVNPNSKLELKSIGNHPIFYQKKTFSHSISIKLQKVAKSYVFW